MLNKWAIIDEATNIVVNTCVWDGNEETWLPPTGCFVISLEDKIAGPGWIWNGETFNSPPENQ